MTTKIEDLTNELAKVAETYRKAAENLEKMVEEMRDCAEDGDPVILNVIVERRAKDRLAFKRHRYVKRIDSIEHIAWKKLSDETWIEAVCRKGEEPN